MNNIDDMLDALEEKAKKGALQEQENEPIQITEEDNNNENTGNFEPKNDTKLPTVAEMSFNEVVENAKKSNLISTSSDKNFVDELSEKNKDVLKESIELEKERVGLKRQEVKLEQEKLETEKEKSLNERLREKFGSKLDEQEYYYKSLKPILETVGVKNPMNVVLMWIIAIASCLLLIYPIKLLFCATFGNLIAGASNENRKGFAKGCLWTAVAILGIAFMSAIAFAVIKLGIYLF